MAPSQWVPDSNTSLLKLGGDLPGLWREANANNATEDQSSRFWEAVMQSFYRHFAPEIAWRIHSQQPPSSNPDSRLRRVDSQVAVYRAQALSSFPQRVILLHCEFKGAHTSPEQLLACEAQTMQACEDWCNTSRTDTVYGMSTVGTRCQFWRYRLSHKTFHPLIQMAGTQYGETYNSASQYVDAKSSRSWEIIKAFAETLERPPVWPLEFSNFLAPSIPMPSFSLLAANSVMPPQPLPPAAAQPSAATESSGDEINKYSHPLNTATDKELLDFYRRWTFMVDASLPEKKTTDAARTNFKQALTFMERKDRQKAEESWQEARRLTNKASRSLPSNSASSSRGLGQPGPAFASSSGASGAPSVSSQQAGQAYNTAFGYLIVQHKKDRAQSKAKLDKYLKKYDNDIRSAAIKSIASILAKSSKDAEALVESTVKALRERTGANAISQQLQRTHVSSGNDEQEDDDDEEDDEEQASEEDDDEDDDDESSDEEGGE